MKGKQKLLKDGSKRYTWLSLSNKISNDYILQPPLEFAMLKRKRKAATVR